MQPAAAQRFRRRDRACPVRLLGDVLAEEHRRGAEFLFRALSPPGARPADTPARPRLVTPAEFADPLAADLGGVDCVYLADVPVPTPELAAKLDAVLRRGGGVVIGLGPNAAEHKAAYNRYLFNDGSGVLPGPLGDVVTAAGDSLRLLRDGTPDEIAGAGPTLAREAMQAAVCLRGVAAVRKGLPVVARKAAG